MRLRFFAGMAFLAATVCAHAAIVLPEHLYYKFNEGSGSSTANTASPGSGAANATVVANLNLTAVGVSGGALGSTDSTGYVDTGWNTNIGTGSWTIAFWHSGLNSASTSVSYLFGDGGAASFRGFTGGVAGTTGLILRGGGATDTLITGLSLTANNHIAFVYDSSLGNIKGYLNGVLATTVAQGAVNLTGTGFRVGNRSGATATSSLLAGRWLDEFQVYGRALDASGVQDAMNASFVPEPGTMAVLGLGAAALLRRRRKS